MKPLNLEIIGAENLEVVQRLNEKGTHVIIAPNHLVPYGTMKRLVLAEDYFLLRKILRGHELDSRLIVRGDIDMKIDSELKKWLYLRHSEIFSALLEFSVDAIPIKINIKEPRLAMIMNAREGLKHYGLKPVGFIANEIRCSG